MQAHTNKSNDGAFDEDKSGNFHNLYEKFEADTVLNLKELFVYENVYNQFHNQFMRLMKTLPIDEHMIFVTYTQLSVSRLKVVKILEKIMEAHIGLEQSIAPARKVVKIPKAIELQTIQNSYDESNVTKRFVEGIETLKSDKDISDVFNNEMRIVEKYKNEMVNLLQRVCVAINFKLDLENSHDSKQSMLIRIGNKFRCLLKDVNDEIISLDAIKSKYSEKQWEELSKFLKIDQSTISNTLDGLKESSISSEEQLKKQNESIVQRKKVIAYFKYCEKLTNDFYNLKKEVYEVANTYIRNRQEYLIIKKSASNVLIDSEQKWDDLKKHPRLATEAKEINDALKAMLQIKNAHQDDKSHNPFAKLIQCLMALLIGQIQPHQINHKIFATQLINQVVPEEEALLQLSESNYLEASELLHVKLIDELNQVLFLQNSLLAKINAAVIKLNDYKILVVRLIDIYSAKFIQVKQDEENEFIKEQSRKEEFRIQAEERAKKSLNAQEAFESVNNSVKKVSNEILLLESFLNTIANSLNIYRTKNISFSDLVREEIIVEVKETQGNISAFKHKTSQITDKLKGMNTENQSDLAKKLVDELIAEFKKINSSHKKPLEIVISAMILELDQSRDGVTANLQDLQGLKTNKRKLRSEQNAERALYELEQHMSALRDCLKVTDIEKLQKSFNKLLIKHKELLIIIETLQNEVIESAKELIQKQSKVNNAPTKVAEKKSQASSALAVRQELASAPPAAAAASSTKVKVLFVPDNFLEESSSEEESKDSAPVEKQKPKPKNPLFGYNDKVILTQILIHWLHLKFFKGLQEEDSKFFFLFHITRLFTFMNHYAERKNGKEEKDAAESNNILQMLFHVVGLENADEDLVEKSVSQILQYLPVAVVELDRKGDISRAVFAKVKVAVKNEYEIKKELAQLGLTVVEDKLDIASLPLYKEMERINEQVVSAEHVTPEAYAKKLSKLLPLILNLGRQYEKIWEELEKIQYKSSQGIIMPMFLDLYSYDDAKALGLFAAIGEGFVNNVQYKNALAKVFNLDKAQATALCGFLRNVKKELRDPIKHGGNLHDADGLLCAAKFSRIFPGLRVVAEKVVQGPHMWTAKSSAKAGIQKTKQVISAKPKLSS